nr:MAG TPA: hypothetical protein [Caudoviricetes sp.]
MITIALRYAEEKSFNISKKNTNMYTNVVHFRT